MAVKKHQVRWSGWLVGAGVVALVGSSCATSQSVLGKWERDQGSLTHVNATQRVRLTFPNEYWEVYRSPAELPEDMGVDWGEVAPNGPSRVILMARRKGVGVVQVGLEPNPGNVDLDQYLLLGEANLQASFDHALYDVERHRIRRNGRSIGFITSSFANPDGLRLTLVFAALQESDRFVLLTFATPETILAHTERDFIALLDSYQTVPQAR